MVLLTSRFGTIEVAESDLIHFADGLLGFPELRKFVLLDDPGDEIFAWLQSAESPDIAFPILEPELFTPNYSVQLAKTDLEVLGIKDMQQVRYYTIVTVPEDLQKMTANMKAPVVLHVPSRTAKQCVLQDNGLSIREPIFTKLQARWVQATSNAADPKPQKKVSEVPGVIRLSIPQP